MRRFTLTVGFAAVLALGGGGRSLASEVTAGAILGDLGFRLGEQVSLEQGQVLSRDLPRNRDNELAAVAAAIIPVPLPDAGDVLLEHLENRAFTQIQVPKNHADRTGAEFGDGRLEPVVSAAEDLELNLSDGEVEAMRDEGSNDVVSRYRNILIDRVAAYSDRGLAGIEPYARQHGAQSSPAAELQTAAESAEAFMASYFPKFARALKRFPEPIPEDIEHRFLWTTHEVDGRPAAVLAHDMVDRTDRHTIVSHREFYVSHTYNSLQRVTVLLPVREQTLALAFNRTFTDRVAGPFSGFEKGVGQEMVRKSLVVDLATLRRRAIAEYR